MPACTKTNAIVFSQLKHHFDFENKKMSLNLKIALKKSIKKLKNYKN